MGSLICDSDGTLYYRNDSYVLMAIDTVAKAEPENTPEASAVPTVTPTVEPLPTAAPSPQATQTPEEEPVDTQPVQTGDSAMLLPLAALMAACFLVCIGMIHRIREH